MSKLAQKISEYLTRQNLIDESDQAIYEFGYDVIIENIVKAVIIFIIGILIHKLEITTIFLIAFITLRGCAGGYHASTSIRCSLVTILLWGFVLLGTEGLTETLKANKILIVLMALVSELIMFQFAPIENINKKLTKEKRLRNRRNAIVLGSLYGILILALLHYRIKASVALALTVLEVAILMIIPSEGRVSYEKTEYFGDSS